MRFHSVFFFLAIDVFIFIFLNYCQDFYWLSLIILGRFVLLSLLVYVNFTDALVTFDIFLILRFQLPFLKSFGTVLSDCPISIVLLTCGIDVSKKFKVDLVYLSSQTFCLLSVHPQVSWDIASRRQQHPSVALFVEMRLHILVKHQHIVWDTANVYRLSGLSCFLPALNTMTFENFWF
jgi:hypothetical protein